MLIYYVDFTPIVALTILINPFRNRAQARKIMKVSSPRAGWRKMRKENPMVTRPTTTSNIRTHDSNSLSVIATITLVNPRIKKAAESIQIRNNITNDCRIKTAAARTRIMIPIRPLRNRRNWVSSSRNTALSILAAPSKNKPSEIKRINVALARPGNATARIAITIVITPKTMLVTRNHVGIFCSVNWKTNLTQIY